MTKFIFEEFHNRFDIYLLRDFFNNCAVFYEFFNKLVYGLRRYGFRQVKLRYNKVRSGSNLSAVDLFGCEDGFRFAVEGKRIIGIED